MNPAVQAAQIRSLYGTPGVFYAAMIATFLVAAAIALRHPTAPFLIWLAVEALTIVVRLVLLHGDRAAALRNQATHTDLYLLQTLIWGAILGYGAAITILIGDAAAAIVVSISCASVSGGMCVRYFGAPRFVATAIAVTMTPLGVACLIRGDPILMMAALLTPMFVFSMWRASRQLNAMMSESMQARIDEALRAIHDPLTGLLNRAGFSGVIDKARRDGGATLFYLDLDRFKQINDRFGHAAGDAVLVEVGQRLAAVAAPDGQTARLGGDEFVLLMPGMDAATARRLGEEIVARITDHDYALGDAVARIGASVGAAPMEAGDTPEEALCRADEALYRAKTTVGQSVALAA